MAMAGGIFLWQGGGAPDDGEGWWAGAQQVAARVVVAAATALSVQAAQPQTFQDEPAQPITWASDPVQTSRARIAPVYFTWNQPDERPTPVSASVVEEQDYQPPLQKPPDWTYIIWATDEEVIPATTVGLDEDPLVQPLVTIQPAKWFIQSDDESAFTVVREEEAFFPVAYTGIPQWFNLSHQDEIETAAQASIASEDEQAQQVIWLPSSQWRVSSEQDERTPTPFEDDALQAFTVQPLPFVAQVWADETIGAQATPLTDDDAWYLPVTALVPPVFQPVFDPDEWLTPATPLNIDEEYQPVFQIVPQPTGWQVSTQENEDVPTLFTPPIPPVVGEATSGGLKHPYHLETRDRLADLRKARERLREAERVVIEAVQEQKAAKERIAELSYVDLDALEATAKSRIDRITAIREQIAQQQAAQKAKLAQQKQAAVNDLIAIQLEVSDLTAQEALELDNRHRAMLLALLMFGD